MNALKDALIVKDVFSKYQQQDFAFPLLSMMKYIMKNCSGLVYEKLVRTCKYFYSVQRVLAVNDFTDSGRTEEKKALNRKKVEILKNQKLWFTGTLNMSTNGVKSLLNFIWRCDITELRLSEQELTAAEFSKISENLKTLYVNRSKIFSSEGQRLTVGDILAMVPQLIDFDYDKNTRYDPITLRQSNNLLPHMPDLKRLTLSRVPNSLDFNDVCEFLKAHPNIYFRICFIKRHWDFAYHGAFMDAVKKEFPAGKCEYKYEWGSYGDRIAFYGDRTWTLSNENMKLHLFGEGE
uniref:Uncharacterized protein n=1 Tax=Panagrolaimus sp. ES5 TaxID=591445 RepID=A0AC34FLS3_9BILA